MRILVSILVALSLAGAALAASCSLIGVWKSPDPMQHGQTDYVEFDSDNTYYLTMKIVNCTIVLFGSCSLSPAAQNVTVTFNSATCGLAPVPQPLGCSVTASYVCPLLTDSIDVPIVAMFLPDCSEWVPANAPGEVWMRNSTTVG